MLLFTYSFFLPVPDLVSNVTVIFTAVVYNEIFNVAHTCTVPTSSATLFLSGIDTEGTINQRDRNKEIHALYTIHLLCTINIFDDYSCPIIF